MSEEIKNTLKNGKVRFMIFKKGNSWYGVALEFNIVEVNKNPEIALFDLLDAISGYVESAIKNKIDISMLNQKVDKEYESIWTKATRKKQSPLVYIFGEKSLIKTQR